MGVHASSQGFLRRVQRWAFPAGAWPTFYATFFGALLGVLGAILVQSMQSRATEITILRHIYCELEGIKETQVFTALASGESIGPPTIYRLPQVEFWDAVTSGGALQKLGDPTLTYILASTYSDIKAVRRFLTLYTDEVLVATRREDLTFLRGIIASSGQLSLDRIAEAQTALRKRVRIDTCVAEER